MRKSNELAAPQPSRYLRAKASRSTPLQQAFGPWRNRQVDTLGFDTTREDFLSQRKQDQRRGRHDGRTSRPKGAPRFWQLPPEQRQAAEVYEAALCRKWAARIQRTPRFRHVLHMITINQFKNPGQSRVAWYKGRSGIARATQARKRLTAGIYDEPQPQRALAGTIVRLPLT